MGVLLTERFKEGFISEQLPVVKSILAQSMFLGQGSAKGNISGGLVLAAFTLLVIG